MIEFNPYNPLHPTENPAYFFGREEAFAFFRQNLVGTPHDHALVLTGRRGLGKSSLVRQLVHQIDDRYRICVANLGAIELTSEAALIAGLVDEIRLALEQAEVSTYRLPDWPAEGVNLREWFSTEYLDITFAALRYRRLLLVLDDAHLLFEGITSGALPEHALSYFADLLAAHSRLDLVFVLDAAFEDHALNTAVLNDPVLHYRLSELLPDAAELLVREPANDVLRYEDGVIEQILLLTDGHPFLLHSVCRLLFRRSEERNHVGPITAHDLRAINEAIEEQAGEIFAPLVQHASPNERLVLVALVELDGSQPASFETIHDWLGTVHRREMNKTQLASALRSLDYQGLIQQTPDGAYMLRAGLSRSWILEAADQEIPAVRGEESSRWASVVGLIAVIFIVGGLGLAALLGVFDPDDESSGAESTIEATTTLSLNLEATRQSDYATQTEQARPTLTPTWTDTPSITPTERPSNTPTRTPLPSATPSPTRTPTTPPSDTPEPSPTNTPRPSRTVTLDPGD